MVSIIITTKNERDNIGNCLKSINFQSYTAKEIEIIVVDNNSVDRTKEIAKAFTENIYNFGPERSAQRNYGAKVAKGKYVLFLDADMILSNKLIEDCVKQCEDKGAIALYIPELITGNSFWSRVRNFERSFYNATCIDCVRFIDREKFLQIDGFDETLTGPEDWDFDRRIKALGSIDMANSCIYHNEAKFNLGKYLDKKAYYSQSFPQYIKKWGRDDSIIKKQLGATYRLWGVFVENGKWKKLLMHPILTLGMYFLRILVGMKYLISRKS